MKELNRVVLIKLYHNYNNSSNNNSKKMKKNASITRAKKNIGPVFQTSLQCHKNVVIFFVMQGKNEHEKIGLSFSYWKNN